MYRLRYGLLLTIVSFSLPLLALWSAPSGGEEWLWMPAGGPSGAVLALCPCPAGEDILVASARGTGVWARNSEGDWRERSTGLPRDMWEGTTLLMVVETHDPAYPWAGLSSDGRLWRWGRAKEEWEPLPSPVHPPRPGILLSSADGQLYYAVRALIYRSTDGGQNWRQYTQLKGGAEIVSAGTDAPYPGQLTAATHTGEVWVIEADSDGRAERIASLAPVAHPWAMASDHAGHIYLAGSGGVSHLWKERGEWRLAALGLEEYDILSLALDTAGGGRLYAGVREAGAFYLDAGAPTWHSLGRGLLHENVHALALDAGGGLLYAGTSRGVWALRLPPAGEPSPSPTAQPTSTTTSTPSPTSTHTRTATRMPSAVPTLITPTPTASPTGTSAPTRTFTPTPSPTRRATPAPTASPLTVETPTATPAPPASPTTPATVQPPPPPTSTPPR